MGEAGGSSRREFLRRGATAAGLALLAGCAGTEPRDERPRAPSRSPEAPEGQPEASGKAAGKPEEEVSPAEDLMREHGVLRRILLIYQFGIHRLKLPVGSAEGGEWWQRLEPVHLEALEEAAGIVRSFVEDYHEKLEEDFLFPRFEKAGTLQELVKVLLEQHQAGRWLTDTTLRLAAAASAGKLEERAALSNSLRQFIRMYAPHAAREDTVLFPAFKEIVTADEYDALGDEFERKENELFGDKGFEKTVDRVATIEKSLRIYDLKQFTPKA
jgi:hemerythrin-like domain-containing protein